MIPNFMGLGEKMQKVPDSLAKCHDEFAIIVVWSASEVHISYYFPCFWIPFKCHCDCVKWHLCRSRGAGHWPRKGEYGDVRPWRPPFHTSPAARKGPISSKRVSSQDPLLEILALTASIFTQILAHKPPNLEIFSSQAPKFGNFQLTSRLYKHDKNHRKTEYRRM